MTNLKDVETRVTVGYSRTLTRTKLADWHICQRRDLKLHHLMLTNMVVIPCLHANLFIVTRALQNVLQVMSEGETLLIKKKSTDISFDKKMANKSGKVFTLTTKFYKSAKYAAILYPKKQKPEGKASIQL